MVTDAEPLPSREESGLTARKRAENEKAEREKIHRSILRAALDGFWLVDMRGRLLNELMRGRESRMIE